jgi:hypothetical protein
MQRNELAESHKSSSPEEMKKFLAFIEEEKKKSVQDLEIQKEILQKQYLEQQATLSTL